jgi:DNA-binding MarR family transcriptional regulator
MNAHDTAASSFWYDESAPASGTTVLEALRGYRAAEMAMRRRTRDSMSMSENELLALRLLLRARREAHAVTPMELAKYLGVSTPSVTAMLDRLARAGHVERHPHPQDRRSVVVESTPLAEQRVRETLGLMHRRMMDAVDGMSEEQRAHVVDFLQRMRTAVDDIAAPPGAVVAP